jgi:ABC-2 type transport system permease protein
MPGVIRQIKDLIRYRHLLWDLAIKDIEVKYRNPTLGSLWAILIPLVTVLLLKLVFSDILKMEAENYPFFIYLMTAVFPWTYFASSISAATESIVSNRELIKKTYFPRQIIPLSVVLASLLNFIPAAIVMLILLAYFKMQFTILIFFLPLIILLQTILTIGLALILSCLQVLSRDIKYIVELGLMAWFYLSPGFYSLMLIANISGPFFKIYMLNPFAGLFVLYRIVLLKGYLKTLPMSINLCSLIIWTVMVCFAVFFLGLFIFKKYEARLPDLV